MLHFKQCIGHLDTQESLGSIGLEIHFKLNESHRHENTLCNLYDTHFFYAHMEHDTLCQKEKYLKFIGKI